MKKHILLFFAAAGPFFLGGLGVGLMLYGFTDSPQQTAGVSTRVVDPPSANVAQAVVSQSTPIPPPPPTATPVPPTATPVPVMPISLKVAGVLEAPVEVVKLECPEDGTIEGYQPGMAWCIPSRKAAGYQYQGGDPRAVNKVFNGHSSSTRGEYGDVFRPLVDKLGKDLEIKFSDGTTQKYKWSDSEIFDPGQAQKKQPAKDGWVLLVTCTCYATETKQECWQCIGGYNTDGKCPSGQLYPRHRLAVWYVAQ